MRVSCGSRFSDCVRGGNHQLSEIATPAQTHLLDVDLLKDALRVESLVVLVFRDDLDGHLLTSDAVVAHLNLRMGHLISVSIVHTLVNQLLFRCWATPYSSN